ncbi:MAG: hypothetical protein FJY56_05540 [Betaproteobacteria bacterium]|nr:hypothetical protein [Betaproteobacteria bacterium]
MGKYLVLIVIALLVYWLVRSKLRRKGRGGQHKTITDDMVRCAQCGVALPRGESLAARELYFCCVEHRERHAKR